MIQLATNRLILRQFKESDLDDYYEYGSMKEVGPMAGWAPFPNKEIAKNRLSIEIRKPYQFAIELKEEKKIIGSIEVKDVKKDRYKGIRIEDNSKEIGCVLSKKYWGKGYMPEAITATLKFCFCELHVSVVYASYLERNIQIGKMDGKCGLIIIGRILDDEIWIDGTPSVVNVVCITKERFEEMFFHS